MLFAAWERGTRGPGWPVSLGGCELCHSELLGGDVNELGLIGLRVS